MQRVQNLTRAVVVATAMLFSGSLVPFGVPLLGIQQADAAVASSIVVRGNTRIDASTVESYLTIRPGRQYGPSDVDESLKTLYATGLFEDVSISQQGGSLIVTVKENPIIQRVSFEGNRRISDETLQGVVRTTESSMLTRARVQSDVQAILEAYRRSGRYRASVEPKVIERGNGRVDLVFEIQEGDKTGVERITFIGNQHFSDGRLRDVIRTRESGLLSWLRTTDTYDPDRLDADQEMLRRFYYRHGYADFRIISAVADLDRENNVFYVTFTVEEGDKYSYGDIEIQTSLSAVDPEALRSKLKTREGKTYSSLDVEKTLEDLTIAVSQEGYAFAEVRPRASRDYENHTISISYYIEEGPRAYVERIEIRGNERTREYVIRREFDIVEGDAYNRVLVDKAERRLRNLNFFKEVRISTQRGSAPDRVIIVVDVEEQPTGEISFGVGYSTADGVIGDITLTEKNFLGRGQYVRAKVGAGEDTQTYEFAFTEPFFLGRRLSLSLEVYRRVYDANSYRTYDQDTTGGGFTFGLPLIEDELTLNLGYQIFNQDISYPCNTSDPDCLTSLSAAIQHDIGETLTSAATWGLVYNTLDNNQNPRDGIFASFNQEFAGVGGDTRYLRTTVEGRYYREVLPEYGVVGFLRAGGGYVHGLGEQLRVADQFHMRDSWLRGFENDGIGPRDARTGDALGGRFYVYASAEAEFPLPAIPQEFGLSGAIFADAGSLWDVDPDIQDCVENPGNCSGVNPLTPASSVDSNGFDPRASIGFGIRWQSPFGPLRADFAWPVIKDEADQTQFFRLSGGTRF